MSRAKLKALEAKLLSPLHFTESTCDCWRDDCSECMPDIEYQALYMEYAYRISTGVISWPEFFYISKRKGFHTEFETYEQYMQEVTQW